MFDRLNQGNQLEELLHLDLSAALNLDVLDDRDHGMSQTECASLKSGEIRPPVINFQSTIHHTGLLRGVQHDKKVTLFKKLDNARRDASHRVHRLVLRAVSTMKELETWCVREERAKK